MIAFGAGGAQIGRLESVLLTHEFLLRSAPDDGPWQLPQSGISLYDVEKSLIEQAIALAHGNKTNTNRIDRSILAIVAEALQSRGAQVCVGWQR